MGECKEGWGKAEVVLCVRVCVWGGERRERKEEYERKELDTIFLVQ